MERTLFAFALLAVGLTVAASLLVGALKSSDTEMTDYEIIKRRNES